MKKRESYLTCSNLVFLKAGKYKVIIIYSTKGQKEYPASLLMITLILFFFVILK